MLKELLPSLGLLALMTHYGLSQNNDQAQAAALATEGKQLSTTIANEAAVQELQAASDQFYAALNAMFTGELGPMNAIWSHSDDVSNQGPFGARMDGWAAVGAQFKKEAEMKLGGHIEAKNVIVRAGKDLGYTVCVEEGQGMKVEGKPVKVRHRATNIFRRENGQWRLVHHHTDLAPLLKGGEKE